MTLHNMQQGSRNHASWALHNTTADCQSSKETSFNINQHHTSQAAWGRSELSQGRAGKANTSWIEPENGSILKRVQRAREFDPHISWLFVPRRVTPCTGLAVEASKIGTLALLDDNIVTVPVFLATKH